MKSITIQMFTWHSFAAYTSDMRIDFEYLPKVFDYIHITSFCSCSFIEFLYFRILSIFRNLSIVFRISSLQSLSLSPFAILNEYYMVRYGALHDAIRVNEKERESGRGYEQVNKIIYFFMVLFVHE